AAAATRRRWSTRPAPACTSAARSSSCCRSHTRRTTGMADHHDTRRSRRDRSLAQSGLQGGFTLIEMLMALMILLLGVTSLLGAMSSSVAQRRTADARHELTAMCEAALLRVQNEAVRAPDGSPSPLQ